MYRSSCHSRAAFKINKILDPICFSKNFESTKNRDGHGQPAIHTNTMEQDSDDDVFWNNFANTRSGRYALDQFEAAGFPRDSAQSVLIALYEDDCNGLGPEDADVRFQHLAGVFLTCVLLTLF